MLFECNLFELLIKAGNTKKNLLAKPIKRRSIYLFKANIVHRKIGKKKNSVFVPATEEQTNSPHPGPK